MTLTTNEELKHLASSDNANELTRRLARECLANREAQPVALIDRRPGPSQVAWRNDGDKLPHGTQLFTAPPAPVVNPEFTGAAAVPDGYCIMPLTLTAANGAKGALSGEFKVSRTVRCHECGGEGCDDCADAGEFEEEITVPWNIIKDIYRAAVEACSTAMLAQPVSQGYTLNSPETPDGCQWTFDEHDSKWDSGCGEAWMFCDGGPTENGVKFCQSCGKPILLAEVPEGGN
ncbi:hypothetical protein ACN2AS_05435 [Serratia liquefaciens]|uniref:hypothetical protein n=1 Tax=Serratia liquefaciens TaxID=614 RepID=UPI003AF3BEEC